jgi:DNA-binding response OmpR family regulator
LTHSESRPRPRILLVEDDLPIAGLLTDALSERGFLVDAVSNGAEALESLSAYRPDAIVLDLMMPTMHGWDFIEHYQDFTGREVIPIIVVSAAGAVPRSAEALGVRRFFAKPFDVKAVVDAVAVVVGWLA